MGSKKIKILYQLNLLKCVVLELCPVSITNPDGFNVYLLKVDLRDLNKSVVKSKESILLMIFFMF